MEFEVKIRSKINDNKLTLGGALKLVEMMLSKDKSDILLAIKMLEESQTCINYNLVSNPHNKFKYKNGK